MDRVKAAALGNKLKIDFMMIIFSLTNTYILGGMKPEMGPMRPPGPAPPMTSMSQQFGGMSLGPPSGTGQVSFP